MSVLLQFFIKNKQNDNRFLFWSCVLDPSPDISKFKLDYLDTSLYIEGFSNFFLKIEHRIFTQEIIDSDYKEYVKDRPEIFLTVDATMQKGSPYSQACSMMKTYYQVPTDFISSLRQFCDIQSDYYFTKFHLQIISTIKKNIGIDILRNESLPGCLSVYRRMPGFSVDGNYNALNGKTRYMTITPIDNNSYENALIEIEIIDKEKILFNRLCKYISDFRFEFTSTVELEHFSEFRVSVYSFYSSNESYSKIFEEHFYLVRSFNLSSSVGGSNYKIGRNRYLNKPMDKIGIMDHQPFSSTLGRKNWVDWEEEYKNVLYGKELNYLESIFFDKVTGREKFLKWARKVISRGQRITIIDPFFDKEGLQDFCACIDTYVKIRILMKDPKEFKQENKIDTSTHLKAIFTFLPGAEIFFIDNIHDRYLIIEEDDKTVVYSLSNSWNGTVNNYSLYIQEVPLLPALEIEEEIEKHIKNGKLQVNTYTEDKNKITQEKDGSIYTESYVNDYLEQLKAITYNTDIACFILICSELFWAYYFKGEMKFDKKELVTKIAEKINLFEKKCILSIISKLVVDLLKKQKEEFVRKNHFLDNKPFLDYNTPEECLKRIGLRNYFRNSYYDLDLDYALYELLKAIFFLFPESVIAELTEKEKDICVLYMDDNGERRPIHYFVSELIICSFLVCKYPTTLPIGKDIVEFIEKVKKLVYCRVFFASAIVYHNREESFTLYEVMEFLKILELKLQELLLLLADMYCKFSIQKQNSQDKNNNETFLNDIVNFVLYTFHNEDIVKYAYKAYIEPYEIKHGNLKDFLKQLEKTGRNDEKLDIEQLLLICSSQTNAKLRTKIIEIINPKEYLLKEIIIPLEKEKPEVIDTVKYHNILPYLGYLFASFLRKHTQKKKFNFHHSLNIDKALVFPLDKFPANMGLFYYEIAFLLSTTLSLGRFNTKIKNEIFDLLDWYLSVCLNAYSDDFYGLSIQVIDLYTTLKTDKENEKLYNLVNSSRDKILITTSVRKQKQEYIKLYKNMFNNFHFDIDKKSIMVFLIITINLCLRCADRENNSDKKQELLGILEQIRVISQETIIDESVNNLINAGIDYANSPSNNTKNFFIEMLNTVYTPYSTRFLFEAIDA